MEAKELYNLIKYRENAKRLKSDEFIITISYNRGYEHFKHYDELLFFLTSMFLADFNFIKNFEIIYYTNYGREEIKTTLKNFIKEIKKNE